MLSEQERKVVKRIQKGKIYKIQLIFSRIMVLLFILLIGSIVLYAIIARSSFHEIVDECVLPVMLCSFLMLFFIQGESLCRIVRKLCDEIEQLKGQSGQKIGKGTEGTINK